jgi:hypothetical protein
MMTSPLYEVWGGNEYYGSFNEMSYAQAVASNLYRNFNFAIDRIRIVEVKPVKAQVRPTTTSKQHLISH